MHTTVQTAMKMSRVAMRDWAIPNGSAAANRRPSSAQGGESPSRRPSGYTHASRAMPATSAGMRQPKERLPNRRMPAAMAILPISGCGQETSSPAAQRYCPCVPVRLSTIALASLA